MDLSNKEEIFKQILDKIILEGITYKQYLHRKICKTGPCDDLSINGKTKENPKDTCCAPFIGCIHASNQLHKLPKHPNCDCYYQDVPIRPLGSISKRQPPPDLWIKQYGFDSLPDYYITKKEAMEKYGWDPSKNTLAGKAPGKMIGNEIYENKEHILPERENRTWKYCDIDYVSGRRAKLRLYYSNDGLMFYSTNHLDGEKTLPIVYWIK